MSCSRKKCEPACSHHINNSQQISHPINASQLDTMMLQKSAIPASTTSQTCRVAGRIASRSVLPCARTKALPEAAEAIANAAPGMWCMMPATTLLEPTDGCEGVQTPCNVDGNLYWQSCPLQAPSKAQFSHRYGTARSIGYAVG
jgi:hypothetical protein